MGLAISPLTLFDFGNLATFIKPLNKKLELSKYSSPDYTILVTTFNSKIPLKNISYLDKIRDKVVICDDGSKDEKFLKYLDYLKNQGYRVIKNGKKKYIKWDFLKRVIEVPSREQALTEGLAEVKTEYTIFLDDDSLPLDDIGRAVQRLDEVGGDLASVKIFPSNKNNLIENLQNIEYNSAMLAREVRPYLTSGACLIGKTSSLKKIMKTHSLFYQGGDIEIGVLAKKMKMKIWHINLQVETEVPNTFLGWTKQRAFWCSGNFRHNVVNFWNYLFDPLHVLYFTGIVWVLLLFKWQSNLISPLSIFLILGMYVFITMISNLKIIKKLKKETHWYSWLLFPLYAGFQVLVLLFAGIYLYFRQAIRFENWGIISIKKNNKSAYPSQPNNLK